MTISKEAIEAGARAIFEVADPFSNEECAKAAYDAMAPIIVREVMRGHVAIAQAAIELSGASTARVQDIAAALFATTDLVVKAKSEGLRDAAELLWPEDLHDAVPRTEADRTARVIAARLRARADQLEGKTE